MGLDQAIPISGAGVKSIQPKPDSTHYTQEGVRRILGPLHSSKETSLKSLLTAILPKHGFPDLAAS